MASLISAEAERYARQCTTPLEGYLSDIAAWTCEHAEFPVMMSGVAEARLLEVFIVASGARRVLEIGTFTGLGAVSMAAALPPGGHVTTLEIDEEIAAAARRQIERSGHGDRIDLVVGDALETLDGLKGMFDLVYIDAWKNDYPAYYHKVLPKLAERGVIVADNLFRGGRALDPQVDDEGTLGIREFARQVQADSRVHNALLTVGDGVMVIWRRPGQHA